MNWSSVLLDILYTVITAAVPVITYYIVNFLGAKFDQIKADTSDIIVSNTLNEVLDTIRSVVTYTSQTYVDSLKASGKFDKEAQVKAFEDTKQKILTLLSESSKSILTTLYGDLDTWLTIQIESTVKNQKM